jgi:hypothetical protein
MNTQKKNVKKLVVVCTPLVVLMASPEPNASADCYAGADCKTLVQVVEEWMATGDTLADDEEYVPGFEDPGSVECMQPGESPGEGYSLSTGGTGCSSIVSTVRQSGFVLASVPRPGSRIATGIQMGKQQQRKKRKKGQCIPPSTVSYGLDTTKPGDYTYHFQDKRGCGQKWEGYWPFPENCGPARANPDCQG